VLALLGGFATADGSATLEQGNTKVFAVVNGPHECAGRALHDRCVINVEYSVAPFAGTERKKRGKGDKRSLEVAAVLRAVLESAVLVTAYSRSQV
jgi:exosome complex component RRP41